MTLGAQASFVYCSLRSGRGGRGVLEIWGEEAVRGAVRPARAVGGGQRRSRVGGSSRRGARGNSSASLALGSWALSREAGLVLLVEPWPSQLLGDGAVVLSQKAGAFSSSPGKPGVLHFYVFILI